MSKELRDIRGAPLGSGGGVGRHMDRRRFLGLTLQALAALGCGGLWTSKRARAQAADANVIYIVIDTVRGDHTSLLGYGRPTTPTLDGLAATSLVLPHVIAPSSWTLPSFASILSGKKAIHHDFNSPDIPGLLSGTVASDFKDAGYQTVSVQTNYFLESLDSEFDTRKWHFADSAATLDENAVGSACAWLREKGGQGKFFMFLGLFCPHQKYLPHPSFSGYIRDNIFRNSRRSSILLSPVPIDPSLYLREEDLPSEALNGLGPPKGGDFYEDARLYQAAYDSEITYSDNALGDLFDTLRQLGLFDNSFIVVTSDHGENMSEGNNYFGHGSSLRQRQIHVPLLIKLPNQQSGATLDNWVGLLDVFPTIYDYLGLPASHASLEGNSLLPLLSGGQGSSEELVSYMRMESGFMTSLALIKDGYKFISTKTAQAGQTDAAQEQCQLFDLANDPGESVDIAVEQEGLVQTFRALAAMKYSEY